MNLLLIGYRGAGKTTVARLLAERLGWKWIDADDEIERQAGKTIAAIFAAEGEPAFRDLESQVLADLVQLNHYVIALGGGAVLRPENREIIKKVGTVVWLTADPQTIHERIAADTTTAARRPNLTAAGGIAEIRALLAQREPFYRQCAAHVLDSSAQTPEQLALAILNLAKCEPATGKIGRE